MFLKVPRVEHALIWVLPHCMMEFDCFCYEITIWKNSRYRSTQSYILLNMVDRVRYFTSYFYRSVGKLPYRENEEYPLSSKVDKNHALCCCWIKSPIFLMKLTHMLFFRKWKANCRQMSRVWLSDHLLSMSFILALAQSVLDIPVKNPIGGSVSSVDESTIRFSWLTRSWSLSLLKLMMTSRTKNWKKDVLIFVICVLSLAIFEGQGTCLNVFDVSVARGRSLS